MDLGIAGKTAIVCGATTDLGEACIDALAAEVVSVFATATDSQALDQMLSDAIRRNNGMLHGIACDPATPEGRSSLLDACPQPDILINHAPGPPIGDFREWSRDDWLQTLNANMLAAIELIGLTLDGMVDRGFGRIVNITSQSVKAPMENLDLSNAARAGLTGFAGGVARERRQADVTINNLLPGMFATKPLDTHIKTCAEKEQTSPEAVTARLTADVPLQRFGRNEEFGAVCAFLCSRNAGYINGQNILVDGGTFRGLL